MSSQDAFQKMSAAVQAGDADALVAEVREAIDEPGAVERIQEAMMSGLRKVGESFASGNCYLPEMIMAAEAFQQGMKLVEPRLLASGSQAAGAGTVVIGTVLTDIHEIGKNVVVTLLKTHGFNAVDLGANVSRGTFVEQAQRAGAQIIAMSALMTTSMTYQRDVLDYLREQGLRDRYLVLVGGGPVDEQWAGEIGADGTSQSAAGAVALAESLVAARRKGAG